MAGTKRGSNIHEAPCAVRLQVCSVVQSSAQPGARVTGARARLLNGGHRDSAAHRAPVLRLAAPARRPLARTGSGMILAVAARRSRWLLSVLLGLVGPGPASLSTRHGARLPLCGRAGGLGTSQY